MRKVVFAIALATAFIAPTAIAQTAKDNKKSMGTSSAPGVVYYDMWTSRQGTKEGRIRGVRDVHSTGNPVIFWDFQDRRGGGSSGGGGE